MNNINSLILEGTVENVDGDKFTLAVARYYRNADGETVEEISHFDVMAYGNLAEQIHEGRGMRLVGRLAQQDGSVIVVAEHIEFKGGKNENI